SGASRVRGVKPEDVDRLVDAALRVVTGTPNSSGVVGEVSVDLLSESEAEFAADPDWWPRAFLDLRGGLKVRARTPEEAQHFYLTLVQLAQAGAFSDHSRWTTGEVQAGTPHRVRLQWDKLAIPRVVAKIAYALAHKIAQPDVLASESLHAMSLFIRGKQT